MTRDKLYSYVALAAILIGLMFLYSLRAEAGTASLSWTAPDEQVPHSTE